MMTFDKGIPIPLPARGRRDKKFYFELMAVGDSQFVPHSDYTYPVNCLRTVSKIANRLKHQLGFTYTVRTLEHGVRIWRIA